jgi:hypothetical protein
MSKARDDRRLAVAHHYPGRLRMRSRAFERNEVLLDTIERWLGEQPGIKLVSAHGPTGGILVAYDPCVVDAGQLLLATAARARLEIAEPAPRVSPAQRVFDAMRSLDDLVQEWSGERFGLGVVVPVALGIASIGSFVSGPHARTPRWDNLLYWGIQFFRTLNEDQRPHRRPHANGG